MLQLEAHFPGKKANTAGIGLKGQLGSEPSCWHRPLAALGTGGTGGGGTELCPAQAPGNAVTLLM